MAIPATQILKYPSRAAQIRGLATRGFTVSEIARHCNCDKADVQNALWQAKHGQRHAKYTHTLKDLEKRMDAIDEILLEIRRQVRKTNGKPDDPCERRLAGLPI